MSDDSPYGRVTNRERFSPLHQAAADLVTELERGFDVVAAVVEPEQGQVRQAVLSAYRLTPSNGGAPVTITLTAFPGVFVRFGERHTEAFPQCGCDGCDEQPEELVGDLRRKLLSVAHGGFRETATGHAFRFADGDEFGEDVSRRRPRAAARRYEPWPLR